MLLSVQQRAYDYFNQAANAGNTHAMAFLGKVGEMEAHSLHCYVTFFFLFLNRYFFLFFLFIKFSIHHLVNFISYKSRFFFSFVFFAFNAIFSIYLTLCCVDLRDSLVIETF